MQIFRTVICMHVCVLQLIETYLYLVDISIWLVQLAANEIKIENASNIIICISFAPIKSVVGTLNLQNATHNIFPS